MAISAGDVMVEIGADTSGLDRGLKNAGTNINQSTNKWGKRMKVAGGVMMAAVTGIGIASLKMAADFDKAMREVNTMMGLNEDEFEDFTDTVQDLAREMGVDAVESANALYQAISAGVPKENAVDFLRIATKAAIGGVTDTTTAVDGLTTVINAFKLPMSDAQKVADIMFTTVKGGKTTMEELSASMFNVAPVAATAGIEFEVVAAALATMTKQGVPTAQATTQLRQAIIALQKPTTDMAKAIEELGYESGQAMLAELGFKGAIDLLTESTEGSNEELLRMFGSVEAGAAIMALTGVNAETFSKDLDDMADSAGAATDAFDEMEKSTSRQLEKLKEKGEALAISIGEALMPALESILGILTPIIDKVSDWASEHPKLTAAILATTFGLGAMMVMIGPMTKLIHGLKWAIGGLAGAQWGLNAALLANPITWIIALIAAWAGVIGILVWKWDELGETFQSVIKGISTAFAFFVAGPLAAFGAAWAWNLFGIRDLVSSVFGWIKDKIFWVMEKIKGIFKGSWKSIKANTLWALDKIKWIIKESFGIIKAVFTLDMDYLRDKSKAAWNAIDTFLGGKLTKIKDFFVEKFTAIKNFLVGIWDGLVDFFRGVVSRIGNVFSTIKEIILSPFRVAIQAIVTAVNWLIRQMNRISFTIPDWVPDWAGGGKTFGINIPEISMPHFAEGGIIPEPTLLYGLRSMKPYAIAGERGPERVTPAGGSTFNFNFYGMVVQERADIDWIMREMYYRFEQKARAMGI